MTTKILHVAIDRCIACRACETACGREHNGISHIFVTPIDDKYSIPLSCLHCEKSPCVDVCPTNALEKTSYSAVTFQKLRCIGCGLCTIVCPFGVIQIDEENTVLKCDKCIHRLKKGKDPACVLTCPTKALIYGKRDQIMGRKRRERASKTKPAKKSTKG
ncbi:MAG: 4Fe-4S dicluster domain-containing protein [Deltaproteobacteria bacterium]|nr:4Fe-4S dicluster domain-containing protein [Deltaproteobacteria bacterium]